MKKLIYILAAILIVFNSCKKNEIETDPLATISVLNAVIDGKVAKFNTALRDSCFNMDYKHFPLFANEGSPIKVYSSGLPNTIYFNQTANTRAGEIYSLFLTGTHNAPESVFIKENIPPYPTQEVINVRLINLAPGSLPLGLTLGDQPSEKVFSNIAYKQISEFKTLSFPLALPANRNHFEIRDSAGNLLFDYEMPDWGTVSTTSSRKRNITIAVKGVVGGLDGNAFGVVVLPHY